MGYADCMFFAEKTSAHKGAGLAGTVLVVAKKLTPAMVNGETVLAVGTPRGERNAVPVATWTAVRYLSRACVEVNEETARTLAPAMFKALEAYDRSPEYRTGHAIEVARAFKRGAYSLQPADPNVLAILCPTEAKEVDDERGFAHLKG